MDTIHPLEKVFFLSFAPLKDYKSFKRFGKYKYITKELATINITAT
jgi:hypothetical protein